MNKKPNILILMTDQQRSDCLSCAGNSVIKTPNMDRLANEGIRFTQATTTSPLCMPARISFISGLYPHDSGVWNNHRQRLDISQTLFTSLKESGYMTAHIGKAHYNNDCNSHKRNNEAFLNSLGIEYVHETTGPVMTAFLESYLSDYLKSKDLFDNFKEDYIRRRKSKIDVNPSTLNEEDYLDSYVGRKAVEFVENYNNTDPMCLFVGFPGPHDPWDAPGKYAKMYNYSNMPPPIPVPEKNSAISCAEIMDDFKIEESLNDEVIKKIRANYYGKISLIDMWFGKILKAFRERDWLDDLLVIFWSDHGEMAGDHGRLHKFTFHESSIRVPLIIRWPNRIPSGITSDALVEISDVYPTIMEAIGASQPNNISGKSICKLFTKPESAIREYSLSEIAHFGPHNYMIRNKDYKYAINENDIEFMLYDLKNDPMEQNNLISNIEYTELKNKLRNILFKKINKEARVI